VYFYRHNRSWIAGRGAKGEGVIAGWSPTLFPADAGSRVVACLKRRKTAGGEGYRGAGAQPGTRSLISWLISLWMAGWGIAAPCRMPLDNRSMSRADGCAKRRAFALPGQCSVVTRVISARRQKHVPPLPPTT